MAQTQPQKSDQATTPAAPAESAPAGAPTTAKALKSVEVEYFEKAPPADKSLAGKYRVSHGAWKLGDKLHGKGSILDLDAEDAKRGLKAGTLEKHEDE